MHSLMNVQTIANILQWRCHVKGAQPACFSLSFFSLFLNWLLATYAKTLMAVSYYGQN